MLFTKTTDKFRIKFTSNDIAVIFAQLLWWFGVHGQAVVNSVMDPIWNTLAIENYAAYSAGAHIPHIVCSTFMGIFPLIGGKEMEEGIDGLSRTYADFISSHVINPKWLHKDCPIVINSWEAYTFDFDSEKLLTLAKAGKKIGAECFVLDDGWFGQRNNDSSSLGDWFPNKEKFPEGITAFADQIHDLGMKLGILYYSPQIWTSDDTDAVERLKIQFGTTLAYPVHTLSNHISEIPNFQVGRKISLNTRSDVAFFGNFGYEMDLVNKPKEELKAMKEQINEYKQIRTMISDSNFYHLASPFDGNETIWALESKNQEMIML